MTQDQTTAVSTTNVPAGNGGIPLKRYLRNPVLRFGGLPLESQLHDPLLGNFIANNQATNNAFVSSNPLSLLFSMDRDEDINDVTQVINGWLSKGDMCSYTILAMHDQAVLGTNDELHPVNSTFACVGRQPAISPLCFVRQHTRSTFSKKRIVYGLPDPADIPAVPSASNQSTNHHLKDVGAPIFNVRRSLIGGNPTHYAYLGSHESCKDVPETHPLYKRAFLVMKTSHHQTDLALNFKFTATLTSIRAPTGDAAVDSVMAVERTSQLVVLGSAQMRDLFVFLRLGGNQDKWSWKNEHAPGMLVATARPASAETINSVLVGPETLRMDVAAGVDARVVLAAVLAAISHYQTYM